MFVVDIRDAAEFHSGGDDLEESISGAMFPPAAPMPTPIRCKPERSATMSATGSTDAQCGYEVPLLASKVQTGQASAGREHVRPMSMSEGV